MFLLIHNSVAFFVLIAKSSSEVNKTMLIKSQISHSKVVA